VHVSHAAKEFTKSPSGYSPVNENIPVRRIDLDSKETRDSLMSPAQLQAWLGCGRTKVYELLQTGEIRSYRVGRLVRIRKQDLEEFLERHRYGA
jgi:excisionase family DNA binding protein